MDRRQEPEPPYTQPTYVISSPPVWPPKTSYVQPTYVISPPPVWPPKSSSTTTTSSTTNNAIPTSTPSISGGDGLTDPPKPTDRGGGVVVPSVVSPGPIDPSNGVNPPLLSPGVNPTATGSAISSTITAAPSRSAGVPGNITLQPGSPISIRGAIPSSESQGGSYTLVPSSMTGTLFAFAFIGVLVIGFVAGALFMKYSRFGRRKEHNKAQGDLTEQLRLLTNTLGSRNDSLDREEKYIQAAANQADFVPPWYHSRQHSAMYPDRLHPQSVPDQTYYQDWATPFGGSSSLVPSSLRQPRVINLPPTQLPPDVEIGGPKGEWLNSNSNTGSTTGSSSVNASYSDLNEFERRRPQIQEEGQGEDSLFNIGATPSHNPHVISIVD